MIVCALGICALIYMAELHIGRQRTKDYMTVLAYIEENGIEDKTQLVHYISKGDFENVNLDYAEKLLESVGYYSGILNDGRYRSINVGYTIGVIFLLAAMAGLFVLYTRNENRLIKQEQQARETEWNRLFAVEEKRLSLELKRNQNYLENVAHQVRTKLTNAEINLDMAGQKVGSEAAAMLEEATFHLDKIDELLCQLLRIGRLESGDIPFEKAEINVGSFITDIIKKRPDRNRIVTDIKPVVAVVDSNWLYEGVVSLIDNCFDNISESQQVGVEVKCEDDRLLIRVRDNGKGFEDDDLEHLFDRFYSKPGNKQASHFGIGLNLTKMVAEAHAGTVKAYNRKEGGACFEIRIPIHKQLKKNKI